jgi:hypothetical protein
MFRGLRMAGLDPRVFYFRLAWNPALLPLNPHAERSKHLLISELTTQVCAWSAKETHLLRTALPYSFAPIRVRRIISELVWQTNGGTRKKTVTRRVFLT